MNQEPSNQEPARWLDHWQNVKKVLRVFYVLCVVLLAADFVLHRHVMHNWEKLPGFYAIFGFVACTALVIVAKEMRKVLMRDEDYYDR